MCGCMCSIAAPSSPISRSASASPARMFPTPIFPIYENKMGYEGQLKTTTLKGELANIGVTAPMITYLAISHSHWDHVGNANDYAGATWLARKAEYDVMFAPGANPQIRKGYAALA